ncbi:MAG: site-2 protease family protein [Alphaproteobacteria bacterium]
MNSNSYDVLKQVLIWLIPGIPAITLHECAHGWMALCLGDPTARDAKRLSLNPLRHIDPVGTLIVPGLMLFAHVPFIFGWAKPVPVDFERLKNGRLGIILVALAGPLANFVMMCGWLALADLMIGGKVLNTLSDSEIGIPAQIAIAGAVINLVLMIFNLVPVPPLDGGRIIGAVLPDALSRLYMRMERYGILIMLVLIATGAFRLIFDPLLSFSLARIGRL